MGVYNYFKRPVYSIDEQIRRTWDLEDMKNKAHKRAFYYSNGEHEKELEVCWVSEPENMKTASFGSNWGYYVGMDEIRRWYLDPARTENLASLCQPMSTWTVEEAEDGKTARGLWYSMSQKTTDLPDGGCKAYWHGEKVGIDFIKEADGWKIWHLFIARDWFCEPGSNIGRIPSTLTPESADFPNPEMADFGTPTLSVTAYNNKYQWFDYPRIPTPYASWDDALGCGPEGHPDYANWKVK